MPTLSVFFGIVVRMYYDDHAPPHFHAIYGEFEAHIGLDPLELIKGSFLDVHWNWCSIGRNYMRMNRARIGIEGSAI